MPSANDLIDYGICWPIYDGLIYYGTSRSNGGPTDPSFPSRLCSGLTVTPIDNFQVITNCDISNPANPIYQLPLDIPMPDAPEIINTCKCIQIGQLTIRTTRDGEDPFATGSFHPASGSDCCDQVFDLEIAIPGTLTGIGPPGPQGSIGATGATGPTGPAGQDGLSFTCDTGDCWEALDVTETDNFIPYPTLASCINHGDERCDEPPTTYFQIVIDNTATPDKQLPEVGQYLGLCLSICDNIPGYEDVAISCLVSNVTKYVLDDDDDQRYIITLGATEWEYFRLYWGCDLGTIAEFDPVWYEKPCYRRMQELMDTFCNGNDPLNPYEDCDAPPLIIVSPRGQTWCRVPEPGDCGKNSFTEWEDTDTRPGGPLDLCPHGEPLEITSDCCDELWYDDTVEDPAYPNKYTRCFAKFDIV